MSTKKIKTATKIPQNILPPYNTPELLYEKCNQLQKKVNEYQQRQKKWVNQKQSFLKAINIMKMQLNKTKQLNSQLMKKCKHKRTSSEQQTFIFNQTNISSYYPVMNLMAKTNSVWSLKQTLKAHLDSVRAIKILSYSSQIQNENVFATGSDDSLVKIWQKDTLKSTIRQHLGPVYSISNVDHDKIVTAGAQGVIRLWNIFDLENPKLVYDIDVHDDIIWQIIKKFNILVTSSSDGTHKVIKTFNSQLQQLECIKLEGKTPNAMDFVNSNQFISGYYESKQLILHDLQHKKVVSTYYYESKSIYHQSNRIIHSSHQNLLASAHQDHQIRFFDLNSNKPIKSIVAHSDSVTSLCFYKDFQIMSISHDGSFRIWDLRQYRCVGDVGVHMKKYDQSALCFDCNENNFITIGGAEGSVKILTPQH